MNNSKSDPCTGCPNGAIVLICIAMLALAGCNPYAGTLYGAAWHGGEKTAEKYLANDSDINQTYAKFHGQAPLHAAVIRGHDDMVEFLLYRGANANVQDEDGNTPLHLAAIGGHSGMVIMLLARDADPTIRNSDGKTPRDLAGRNARISNDLRAAGG